MTSQGVHQATITSIPNTNSAICISSPYELKFSNSSTIISLLQQKEHNLNSQPPYGGIVLSNRNQEDLDFKTHEVGV